jgi:hypothetical protein
MKLQIDRQPRELTIQFRWFSFIAIFLVFFCVAWDGFMFFWYFTALSEGIVIMALFGILHLAVGVGLTYYTLSLFLNSTTIRATPEGISVSHGPLPIPAKFSGIRHLPASDIAQLYVKQEVSRGKNGTTYSYPVRAKLKNGDDILFLSSYIVQNDTTATRLEQELELFLGIRDYAVPEEYNSQGKTMPDALPRKMARTNDPVRLSLNDVRKGFLLQYDLKTWEVAFETQYDWAGQASERQLQLVSEDGQDLLLYLQADLAITTPWLESKLDAYQMKGGQFHIQKDGDEIVRIDFSGNSYLLASKSQGRLFVGSADGQQAQQWMYLSADRQHSLRLVKPEQGPMSTFMGAKAHSHQFSNLLPDA